MEKNNQEVQQERETVDYLTEAEARKLKEMFKKHFKSYKKKDPLMSDEKWLEGLFGNEFPELSQEEIKEDVKDIVSAIDTFDENLKSVTEASKHGVSKERWLAEKIQEASVGMAVQEYGQALQSMDDFLCTKNIEIANELQRSTDGHIKMSPNLDGNIAENMIAKTAELSSFVQGKNIKVEVRDVFTENSVDVRAINVDTGKYQNYQLKFGKDAKATIDLIERGNYNNQQVIVPSEQLEEVRAYFKSKGSAKTITDHIDAWGAKGKSFTKENMKKLQMSAQDDGIMPSMDYSHYQTKDLAMSIGKHAGLMGLQSAAITTGLNITQKIFNGEEVDADEMVQIAIKTGTDTSIKTITAGTLQVAIRKGIIGFIPKATPAGVIANIACVGIENVKILGKIASGEMSITKGLDQMGRVTTSMVSGIWAGVKGAFIGAKMVGWIPVIGPALGVLSGVVGGMVGYIGGSKFGEAIYSAGQKVASVAKGVAKAAFNTVCAIGSGIASGVKSIASGVISLFR